MRAAIWMHKHAAAACWPLLLLLLLDGPAQVLAGSKVACDYSNRLCQWNATYAVGGAVLGHLAFYHGGLYANDATVPVNGSHLEVLDLRTLSPYTMQVEFNPGLQSSRYKHFLLPWDNQLLAVGGQVDDDNGKSVKEMSIIVLDLNTRTWSSLKNFTITRDKAVDMLFDAVAVSGDYLLASVTVYDPAQPRRLYLTMDLNTAAVDGNTPLLEGPQILDWPLVAITSLTADGSTPHLVLQAKRQMPPVKELQGVMKWSVMTDTGGSPAKQVTAGTPLKQQQGGSGGKVLTVNILQVGGKPKLVLLAATSARFSSSPQPQNVTTVVVFDVDASSSSSSRVALQLSSVLLTPPLGWALKGITSLDLPLLGNVAAQELDLGLLPYVGAVDTIGTLDASNALIQPAPGGFVIRGSGLAEQSCQPGATWQPFVFKVTFGQQQPAGAVLINPSVVALSNYTWCSTRRQQIVAAHITNSGAALETNTGIFRVDSPSGTQLMLLNAQPLKNPGGQLITPNKKAPLMGAFINLNTSSVANFTISTPGGYIYPKGLASCMTRLQGRPVYVETGGTEFDADRNEDTLSKGVYVMDATVSAAQHSLLAAAGGGGTAPGFVHSALACTPDGQLFLFGGLRNGGRRALNPGGDAQTSWEPTNSLTVLRLSGSPGSPSVSKDFEFSSSSTSPQPAARSGQAMAYLPPSVASSLGLSQGGLVMYGGSNIPATLQDHLLDANATAVAAKLRGTQWDTTTWLFDVAARKWVQLATQGAGPPGLMYHSMTAAGQQVVVWGGQAFNTSGPRVRLSSMMYVLDFASRPPRWRQAHIHLNNQGAFQFEFPSTGLVMLPEFGAVALKHRSAVNLAPIPQSLEFRGSEADILSRWGLNTLNTTAGDWLRLAPSQPTLKLQQPLLVAADVLVSGVVPAAGGSNNRGSTTGRRLQQQQQQSSQLQLVCDADQQPGSAVQIRAGGAELSQVDISGCAGTAVDVRVDATGAYTSPARLTNVTLRRNRGVQGAALYVGPSAAATLQAVTIAGNTGPEGVVFAAQRSSLTLTKCSLSGNNGTAVVFAGSSLTVQGSSFTGNTATGSLSTVSAPAPAAARSSKSGGALRLLCFEPGPGGYDSVVVVSNSSFSSNRGVHGGALYAGRGTTLRLTGVVCTNNSGYDGGVLFADRDACVEAMVNSSFINNNATARGGAVKMHNPSCSSLSWSGGVFSGNSAGDGGALYLTEITTRTINGSATYTHNTATRPPASRGAGTGGSGGTGGAVYLGLWGSDVLLHNSTFTNNRAMQLGGAVHALAIDSSSIRLHRVNATGNSAALQSPGLSDEEAVASMLRSEGGALHVDGSVARVIVSDSTLTGNMAGRGGAVSANTQGGSVLIDNSTISSNTALTAGGGVSVTERKSVTVTRSTLAGNTLVWQELAAGGGLYCFLCERVNITSSTFDGNRAAYGGGAAILQPWQASVVTNTSFTHNVALPDPLSELGTAADRRRRRSLLVESTVPLTGTFSGSRAVIPTRVGGQTAAVAILGPLAANVTGDSGYYTGGGGLYVSLSSSVRLEQCAFLSNTAFNGGGFLARTDACRPASNSSSGGSGGGSKCQLQLSRVSVRNNTASAAGGALITNIRPEVVTLTECSSGSALSRATLACLEARNSLMQSLEADGRHQQHSSGRSLLQDTADCSSSGHCMDSHSRHLGGRYLLQQPGSSSSSSSSDASAGAPSNEAVSGYGDFLLTSAASVKCQNLLRLGGGEELWQDDDCSLPIRAPPGQPFGRSFVLLDGLGDPIADGIYDSRMPMAAVAQAAPGSVPYRIFGNTTQAQNGTARFTGLTVNGKPGDTVTLLFSTQNGLTLSRQVMLRRCQAGEYTDNSTSAPNELSFSCRPCQSPQFSFYPAATACSQCAALPANSWAVCNEAALVPADGFYQSHPRSPVLSRCISSLACRRSDATRRQMATWAYTAANLSTAQMNSSVVAPYMDSMCAQGYTGPLCGACEPMYGHTGTTCVKCLASGANSFLYFLVCCFMLVVPAVQMVLHAKGVNRNTQLLAAATAAGGKLSWTQSRAGSAGPGGPNMLAPLAEGGSEEQQQHQQVAEERPAAANGAAVEMANMHTLYVCPSAAVAAGAASQHLPSPPPRPPPLPPVRVESVSQSDIDFFRMDQDSAAAAAAAPDMYSPFSEASAVARAIATRDGSGTSFAPSLSDAHMSAHMVGPRSGVPNTRGGSLLLRLFDTTSVDHQAAAAWGYARAGSMQSPRGTRQPAPVSAQGSVHRRSYKFWHADILSMLINYMQLLGLLRLVRINWAEQLSKMLVYLDFTSGASTWVSVECSLDPYSTIPRSVARSIVVLLWPLVALLAVGAFWAAAAFLLRHRPWARRRLFFRRWLCTHVVMCVVILLYFLYTTTTRELVSLFSCSQVDDPLQLPHEVAGHNNPLYAEALSTLTYMSSGWSQGFWTSDTHIRCGSPAHVGLAVGLGVPGVLLFALGLPIGLAVYLTRIARATTPDGHSRLEDPEVELQFGSVYEKYRYGCYFWECLILLEAFTLTLLLVMLATQNNAALQVLVAMAVIFVEAVLHITFQPYACRLLDTLRRLAVYGLMSTCFMLMLVTLSEAQDHDRLLAACMIIVALINTGVIAVHLWACGREVKRWLLWTAGKGPNERLTWADVLAAVPEGVRDSKLVRRISQQPLLRNNRWAKHRSQRRQQSGARRGDMETVPEAEGGSRSPTAAGGQADEQGPGREGVTVVINPTSAQQRPTPGWVADHQPHTLGGNPHT